MLDKRHIFIYLIVLNEIYFSSFEMIIITIIAILIYFYSNDFDM